MMKPTSSSEFDRLIIKQTDKDDERSCCFICLAVFISFALGSAIFLSIMFFLN